MLPTAQRQLQELQHNERGRFANLLSMASPLPTHGTQHDAAAEQMGSPMSGRQHPRRSSDWSASSQPGNEPRTSQNSIEMAARPKIQPVFRPIKKQPAAEEAQTSAADPKADGHEEMVQILLQQVHCCVTVACCEAWPALSSACGPPSACARPCMPWPQSLHRLQCR